MKKINIRIWHNGSYRGDFFVKENFTYKITDAWFEIECDQYLNFQLSKTLVDNVLKDFIGVTNWAIFLKA